MEKMPKSLNDLPEPDEADVELVADRQAKILQAFESFLATAMGYDNPDEFRVDEFELECLIDSVQTICTKLGYPFYRPEIVRFDGKWRLVC